MSTLLFTPFLSKQHLQSTVDTAKNYLTSTRVNIKYKNIKSDMQIC